MAQGKAFNFDQQGVSVNVYEQVKKIKAVSLPLDSLDKMKGKAGGFQPGRLVINIALVDEDRPDEFLSEIDPPFELRIRYTRGDVERAQRQGKPLQLAFWDGNQWVVFTREKHQFELQPSSQGDGGGFGVVRISRWGDPNISWGG